MLFRVNRDASLVADAISAFQEAPRRVRVEMEHAGVDHAPIVHLVHSYGRHIEPLAGPGIVRALAPDDRDTVAFGEELGLHCAFFLHATTGGVEADGALLRRVLSSLHPLPPRRQDPGPRRELRPPHARLFALRHLARIRTRNPRVMTPQPIMT